MSAPWYVKLPSGHYVNLSIALEVRPSPDAAQNTGRRVAVSVMRSNMEGGNIYYDDDADAIIAALEDRAG